VLPNYNARQFRAGSAPLPFFLAMIRGGLQHEKTPDRLCKPIRPKIIYVSE